MKVWTIVDDKGRMVSSWPKLGIAKIHCRKELRDRIVEGVWYELEKPKNTETRRLVPKVWITEEALAQTKKAKKSAKKRGKK